MGNLVDFSTSNRIIFGAGCLNRISALLEGYGRRALFLQKSGLPVIGLIHQILEDLGIAYLDIEISGEPDITRVDLVTMQAREFGCDFAIGLGGGSVLDTGKAVAAMLANSGNLLDYLEVVGKGKPLKNKALPYIAIPTTSGTGSEVTKNAVISVPEEQVKVSMRHNFLLPEIALVDPELTHGLPASVTAFSGMDALTQVIEPYLSEGCNWMVDMFCQDAIQKAGRHLLRAYQHGNDNEARLNMSWVSLMGGLSLANAQLGAVHGLAGPMGGMFNLPHGMICAALLHAVMEVNYRVILAENRNNPVIERFSDVARWLTGNNSALPEDGINYLRGLTETLNIPCLSEMGLSRERLPELVEKSKQSSSMKGNPVALDEAEILEIIEKSFIKHYGESQEI